MIRSVISGDTWCLFGLRTGFQALRRAITVGVCLLCVHVGEDAAPGFGANAIAQDNVSEQAKKAQERARELAKQQQEQAREAAKQAQERAREQAKQQQERAREQAKQRQEQVREQQKKSAERSRETSTRRTEDRSEQDERRELEDLEANEPPGTVVELIKRLVEPSPKPDARRVRRRPQISVGSSPRSSFKANEVLASNLTAQSLDLARRLGFKIRKSRRFSALDANGRPPCDTSRFGRPESSSTAPAETTQADICAQTDIIESIKQPEVTPRIDADHRCGCSAPGAASALAINATVRRPFNGDQFCLHAQRQLR